MIKVSADADRVLVAKLHEAAQDQVFDSWDRLTPQGQTQLLDQLRALDLLALRKLIARYLQGTQEVLESKVLSPPPVVTLPVTEGELAREAEARAAGEEALRKGQVGVLTMAGEVFDSDAPNGSRG